MKQSGRKALEPSLALLRAPKQRDDAEAEAIRRLWEEATQLWDGPEEMRDSSTAYPGGHIRGKDLWAIGVVLGFIEEAR